MNRLQNLKNKVLLLLLLAVAGLAKAQQWKELHTGVSEYLYGVCCIDTNTVFVCGLNGVILKTEDGGNSWQEKYRQTDSRWYKIKFFDSNNGFVLGDDGNYNNILFKTTDGGETWLNMGNPFSEYNPTSLYSSCDLFLIDSDTLYVACSQLMKSIDGGCNFSQLDIDVYLTHGLYFEENVGYVVWGDAGSLIGSYMAKTTNYGASWEEIITYVSENEGIKEAFFHDKDHVSVYGAFGYDENEGLCEYNEIRTEDGFATYQWLKDENLPLVVWFPIPGVCFSDPQNGIMVSYWESFIYPYNVVESGQTLDGGNTWLVLNELAGSGICYPAISGREGVYYLACGSGCVFKLEGTYDGVTEEKEAYSVKLHPNPTSGIVQIEGAEAAEVMVYNVLGQQVKAVQNANEVSLEGLPQGVYLLRITTEDGKVFSDKVVKD